MQEKAKASIIHLSISILIIGLLYLLTINIWYPSPYFQVSGLLDILIILVIVDLILGPLLTFIIYKPKKNSLKFDLSVVAFIQISALFYGAFTIYEGRPVYVAYVVDRFTLVAANEVNSEDVKHVELKTSTFDKPKLVYAKSPENLEERNMLLFQSIGGGPDLEHHPEYYEPIEQFTKKIVERSISSEKLLAFEDSKTKLGHFLKKQGNKNATDFAYLPLMGKEKVMLWAINRETGKPIAALDIDPWELGNSTKL